MQKTVLLITREIIPFYYGGIGTQFKAMADLLVSSGFNVVFLTQYHTNFDNKQFEQYYPKCGIFFVDQPWGDSFVNFSCFGGLVSHFNLDYALAVNRDFETFYKRNEPEFVVSADFGAEAFFCLLRKQAGAYSKSKFVLFIAGSTYDSLKTYESDLPKDISSELDDPQNRLTCSMENTCVRLADSIVSPTNLTWQQSQQRLGLTGQPYIIPNLVGPDFLKKNSVSDERQRARTLMFVGRLDTHKGADLLLQAFLTKYGQSGNMDIPTLRFVGRDTFCKKYGMTFLDYWKQKIPSHLGHFIDFTGQVEPHTVKEYLAKATLCVFPSRWEVFGIVCLEAMASGCPVVVSSNTGLSEVVGDGFQDYKIDFTRNSKDLFDLSDRLLNMEPEGYRILCKDFRQRAVEVVASGNKALLEFFNTKPVESSTKDEQKFNKITNDTAECLSAASDISSILAHDLNKIATFYNLTEEAQKNIIFSKSQLDSLDKTELIPMKKRLGRFLIKQIEKFTH